MKKLLTTLLLLTLAWQAGAEEAKETSWDELLPPGETANAGSLIMDHTTPAGPQAGLDQVKLNLALNGKHVKLPGFAVPLAGDADNVTEFLLVPYFGACIHVPPPPANQIVLVRYPEGASVDLLWDAIWVSGPITTTSVTTDMAQVGYAMEATSITVYE